MGISSPNIWTAAGPAHELDFDIDIEQAKEIYKGMFPGEEFLPRAPDPEEIAFGDEETTAEETTKVELLPPARNPSSENVLDDPEEIAPLFKYSASWLESVISSAKEPKVNVSTTLSLKVKLNCVVAPILDTALPNCTLF